MTEPKSELSGVFDAIAGYWTIVLAAVLVGALAMGAYAAMTVPEQSYKGCASVRVMNLTGNAAAPTVDTVAAAAVDPSVRDRALKMLGPDAEGAGEVSSEVEPKDRSIVNIYALHTDPEAAKRYAAAVRSVATSTALEPLSVWREAEAARLASYRSELERIEAELERLEKVMPAYPDESGVYAAVQSLRAQRLSLTQAVRDTELRIATYDRSVSEFGEPTVSKVSHERDIVVAAIQGALVGLVVGCAAAVITSRRREQDAAGRKTA